LAVPRLRIPAHGRGLRAGVTGATVGVRERSEEEIASVTPFLGAAAPRRRPIRGRRTRRPKLSWENERLRMWVLTGFIHLFWLVPATSLVALFADHPVIAAGSLALGMAVGVLLGVWRRRLPAVIVVAAATLGGAAAIFWQSLYMGGLPAVVQATFGVGLDVWAPAALGAALGVPSRTITDRLRREYAPRPGKDGRPLGSRSPEFMESTAEPGRPDK
jgi:hypothetical protein